MSPAVTSFVAALPVLTALVLLTGLRWPALRAMPVCGAVTALLATVVWGVPVLYVTAAFIEGAIITCGILLILFGALLLTTQLGVAGAMPRLQAWIGAQSQDRRIQVLLVAWIFGSFLEGAAGFGAPAALTAPLLVALGFPALMAVIVALVGDSVAVIFGAVGTPLLVGMDETLAKVEGAGAWSVEVGQRASLYDLFTGSLMPLLLVLTLTVGTRGKHGWAAGLQAAPFALVVGGLHTGGAALVAHAVGPELPSLIGPALSLLGALLMLRTGLLLPNQTWCLPADAPLREQPRSAGQGSGPSLLRSLLPYALLVALLVVTRLPIFGLTSAVRAVEVGWWEVLGTDLTATVRPLHSPGFLFILVALATVPLFRLRPATLIASARASGARTVQASVALLFAVVTVRIFIHSGQNDYQLDAMPLVLATVAAQAAGDYWPMLAPWVGALGSFIAGSATFSNMLFAPLQQAVAVTQQLEQTSILALQAMGAAAGNMVCIHNVVAATAVVGLVRAEGEVIRRTCVPMAVYLLLAGVVGIL